MSESEELTKQQQEVQAQQAILQNWISLKKNLQVKYKTPSEAFKHLAKENAHELTVSDFDEFSKGLNLTELFKDTQLNEESFIKVWEQWEFKVRANEHKLQMIDEKLEVLAILEDKETKLFKDNPNKKKFIVSQIKGCENLEELHKKLGEMAQTSSSFKPGGEVVPNESDIFTEYLAKKSKISFNELSISKMQVKLAEIPGKTEQQSAEKQQQNSEQKLVESQIIITGKVSLPKKSYLESQHSILNRRSNYSQNQSKTFISDTSSLHLLSPKLSRKKDAFKSPRQFHPQPNFEENDQLRRSQKSKRMKGELQNYIGELFQCEQNKKPFYDTQQRGLAGFLSHTRNYKNQQQRIEFQPSESLESTSIQRRVESIKHKLSDFANKQQRRRYSPQKQYLPQGGFLPQDKTPERKYSPRKSSPYTPGNVHRLNVDRLKLEQDREKKSSDKKQAEPNQENQEPSEDVYKGLDRQKAFVSD